MAPSNLLSIPPGIFPKLAGCGEIPGRSLLESFAQEEKWCMKKLSKETGLIRIPPLSLSGLFGDEMGLISEQFQADWRLWPKTATSQRQEKDLVS